MHNVNAKKIMQTFSSTLFDVRKEKYHIYHSICRLNHVYASSNAEMKKTHNNGSCQHCTALKEDKMKIHLFAYSK